MAVKLFPRLGQLVPEQLEYLRREVVCMMRLEHPHVVAFKEVGGGGCSGARKVGGRAVGVGGVLRAGRAERAVAALPGTLHTYPCLCLYSQ